MPKRKEADTILRKPTGMTDEPNIDLTKRRRVKNEDGSESTLGSMSFGDEEGEHLIPTVREDGWYMSPDEAVKHFRKTGKHLGRFKTPEDATAYAKKLSDYQKRRGGS